MKKPKQKTRHQALMRLRSLCGKTAEQFSRLAGIGYAQLVAVEQGRRELSASDAKMISAATGVDPAFNEDKTRRDLKALWGLAYDEGSLKWWQDVHLPALRKAMRDARLSERLDPFAEVLSHNATEVVAAARVQGKELAVACALGDAIQEVCDRFGLGPSVCQWKSFQIEFKDVRSPSARKRATAETHHTVKIRVQTATGQGLGRVGDESSSG